MLLGPSGLENHPDGTGNINAIVSGNWNVLDQYINKANGMSASQTSNVITITGGAPLISDDVGATIVWSGGQTAIIAAVVDSSHATATVHQSVSAAAFDIYRADVVQTPYTALARGLAKRTRMIAGDDGLALVWSNALQCFVMTPIQVNSFETLGTTGSIALNFAGAATAYTGQLTGNITVSSSGLSPGAKKTLVIIGKTSGSATLSFPGWQFVGSTAPSTILANKFAKLVLLSTTSSDSGVVAEYNVQP